MRTCVIGGGGFIGRYLVEALVASGRGVLVLGRRSERPADLSRSAVYSACDYTDRSSLRSKISDCDEIVDLAYATVPQTSFANPIYDLQANLAPCVGLFEEVRDIGRLRRLVVTSSGGTVYGPAVDLPISEEDRTSPISPYGITKLTIERYALMFHVLSGLPVTIVRPANAYGLGQRPFTGQGFIATAMGRILKREPVTIFGEHGTIRDYIHVRDVASGIVCALESGRAGEIYNVGSGVGRSNREVVNSIRPFADAVGLPVEIDCVKPRGFDVPSNVLNCGKLSSHTNWHPRVPFDEGLLEMWQDMPAMLGLSK
jgi:UDP-glucose 4-epimerase